MSSNNQQMAHNDKLIKVSTEIAFDFNRLIINLRLLKYMVSTRIDVHSQQCLTSIEGSLNVNCNTSGELSDPLCDSVEV